MRVGRHIHVGGEGMLTQAESRLKKMRRRNGRSRERVVVMVVEPCLDLLIGCCRKSGVGSKGVEGRDERSSVVKE